MSPAATSELAPPPVSPGDGDGRPAAPGGATAPSTARERRSSLLALGAYTLLAVALFASAWASPSSRTVGTGGDPLLTMWFLRWTPHAVGHFRNPFFTDHLNAPHGVNLMWNTVMVLPGLVLWPVTALFGPVVSYNVLATANVALSAWAARWAFVRLVGDRRAAFVGGLLYGFSPYMVAESVDHANLTAAFLAPLVLVAVNELVVARRRPPWQPGVALGLLAAAQLLVSEELMASQAVAVLAGLAVLAAYHGVDRQAARRVARAAGPFLVAFTAVAAFPLAFQLLGPQRVHGAIQPPNVFVTDLANLVLPTAVHRFGGARLASSNLSEQVGYLGVPLLALLGLTVRRLRSDPRVRVAATLAGCLTVLSLGPSLHLAGRDTGLPLPWAAVDRVPLLNDMLPNRLMLYVDLMAALLVALLVARLLASPRPPGARRLGAAAGLALASLLPAAFPSTPRTVPAFFRSQASRLPAGSVALVAPIGHASHAEPMLWQAAAGLRFRMPQGYFVGPDADGHPMYGVQPSTLSTTMEEVQRGATPSVTPALAGELRRDLAERRVATVLVGPMNRQDEMLRFFAALFGRSPTSEGDGVYAWWGVDARTP